jgi:hypothetical protein
MASMAVGANGCIFIPCRERPRMITVEFQFRLILMAPFALPAVFKLEFTVVPGCFFRVRKLPDGCMAGGTILGTVNGRLQRSDPDGERQFLGTGKLSLQSLRRVAADTGNIVFCAIARYPDKEGACHDDRNACGTQTALKSRKRTGKNHTDPAFLNCRKGKLCQKFHNFQVFRFYALGKFLP